jgi:hypothetical protein
MSGIIGNSGQKSGLFGIDNVYFAATDNGTISLTHNTDTLVTSYDVIRDSHGGFSGGRYTIPIGGTWQFHLVSEFYNGNNDISFGKIQLWVNGGVSANYAYNKHSYVGYADSGGFNSSDGIRYVSVSNSLAIAAAAGTIFDCRILLYTSDSSAGTGNGVNFSGYRLGV